MTDLRTAAQQALEALENTSPLGSSMESDKKFFAAITALRAALAEPQEPVAWLFTNLQSGDYDFCYQEDEHDHDREMWHKQPLYTAQPQRPAEPVQEPVGCDHCNHPLYAAVKCRVCGRVTEPVQEAEPVAWAWAWVASPDGRVIYDDVSADDGLLRVSGDFENDEQRIRYAQRIVDKLNAAPPQRLPLTSDKDRPDQGATYVEGYGYVDTRAVRAIERAHGIGGEE